MALIRSVSTDLDDHGLAKNIVRAGRQTRTATEYPELGAVVAKGLERPEFSLPGHIRTMVAGVGGRGRNASYLGPGYASVSVGAEAGGLCTVGFPRDSPSRPTIAVTTGVGSPTTAIVGGCSRPRLTLTPRPSNRHAD